MVFFLLFSLCTAVVHEFTPKTFKDPKIRVVLYYVAYGDNYKNFLSTYEEISRRLTIEVGSLDCEEYEDYCETNSIHTLPLLTVKTATEEYIVSKLSTDSLKQTLAKVNIEMEDIKPINVIDMCKNDDSNVFSTLKEPLFIKFYAPWCGHCRKLKPVFENVSRTSKVQFAEVNCDACPHICSKFSVSSYPTLLLFTPGKEPIPFQGQRTEETLTNFLTEKTSKIEL
ncbi:protein disulfide-isomerase tigA precursor, putative [Entamoeba invadens IP1]|uniref:Protein disulfide-isomerase tigA, putative n=1 Tax=Entamoeba invadens IP1 TaxID=370355 RepID=A0A0A1UAU3_ENTIV|nr:protein disulfide-isomerase tigA precursor, putative [Entamoeba invadens IP1]ELP92198.1 protein disulfide-isomerase tigA precursor, putative [Entamoeba invadens IP1]|eukprot:XP_004258969.1 protein disulfide-isomerase tigA precursor, putative [Entamoeba invadens IP1]